MEAEEPKDAPPDEGSPEGGAVASPGPVAIAAVGLSQREKLESAQKRLAMLLDVNRRLHRDLAVKTELGEKMKGENKQLRSKMEGRGVEEPARRVRIEELQSRLQKEGSTQNMTAKMQAKVASLEEEIGTLNQTNLKLSDQHRIDKAKITEQQTKMKMLNKRIKELSKHIEFIANHLNEAQVEMRKDAEEAATEEGPDANERKKALAAFPAFVDYRNLPGLHLSKLLAEEKKKHGQGKLARSATRDDVSNKRGSMQAPVTPVAMHSEAEEAPQLAESLAESPRPENNEAAT